MAVLHDCVSSLWGKLAFFLCFPQMIGGSVTRVFEKGKHKQAFERPIPHAHISVSPAFSLKR